MIVQVFVDSYCKVGSSMYYTTTLKQTSLLVDCKFRANHPAIVSWVGFMVLNATFTKISYIVTVVQQFRSDMGYYIYCIFIIQIECP